MVCLTQRGPGKENPPVPCRCRHKSISSWSRLPLGCKVPTQNTPPLSRRKDISSGRLSLCALADDTEQFQGHSGAIFSSPETKGGREDPHGSPPTGAGSPQREGEVRRAGRVHRAGNTTHSYLRNDKTPPNHPKNVRQWCPAPLPFSFAGGTSVFSPPSLAFLGVLRVRSKENQGLRGRQTLYDCEVGNIKLAFELNK